KKKSANVIDEYSVWKPATSSASDIGRSKGVRLVSARAEMKKITNIGSSGMKNQCQKPPSWARTTLLRFNDPTQSSTQTKTKPIDTSYDTIWAAERSAPRNAYFELLAQPAMMMP